MRLQRLFDMGPAEMAFRGRQEVFKAVERLSPPPARRQAPCRFDRSACSDAVKAHMDQSVSGGSSGISRALQDTLQAQMEERFFAGLAADWREGASRFPADSDDGAETRQLIARADAVCRMEFDILGYGTLSFGNPVNWRLDPVAGRVSPAIHWSRIDPLAPSEVGDSKVVWELNRHQWLLDLGQAWRLTGDDRYADCFVSLVTDWIEKNPFTLGINWSSALEVAMRALSWCWALCLFRDAPALTPERFQVLLGALQRHAGFIERYQSRYFAPNTHLTVEALALYTMGTLLPELRGARRWRTQGRELLLEQLPLQVPEGGVYFEQSTRYQYYTVEIYLQFAILAARNADPLPDEVNIRLRELLHFLLDVRRPDGTVPQIGDTDGGWLCPLIRREVGDYRGLFSTAAVFLNDPNLAWAAGSLTQEAFCFLGAEAKAAWDRLRAKPPEPRKLSVHQTGGYVIMRTGWDRDAHQLIFDTGPLGCHICGGHGHADLLAIQCSAFGENYLVDPGTGCYRTGSAWRDHFRSTRSHNTVRVDGLDQAETRGPFSWGERPSAALLGAHAGQGQVFAAAEHAAYGRLTDPVTHQRRVWLLDTGIWLIVDDLVGKDRHQVDLRFQFAPLSVDEEADGWLRARGKASGLLLKTFSATNLQTDLTTGALSPPLGWYSPNYGQQVPAPAFTVTATGRLPLRLATLMIPSRDPKAAPPSAEPRFHEGLLTALTLDQPHGALPPFHRDGLAPSADAGTAS